MKGMCAVEYPRGTIKAGTNDPYITSWNGAGRPYSNRNHIKQRGVACIMRALIKKIRQLLKDRRFRKIWYRGISATAAVVVFITTYALVLPAITMETEAKCGIPAHQHTTECYEEQLICGQEESDGHHHTDDCYTVTKELTCEIPEHKHDKSCFDEEGNLTCSQDEHSHSATCYEEHRELTCGLEESDGHHHDSSCYKQVLTCGLEAHIHSAECYKEDSKAVTASTSTPASEDSGTAVAAAAASTSVPVKIDDPEYSSDASESYSMSSDTFSDTSDIFPDAADTSDKADITDTNDTVETSEADSAEDMTDNDNTEQTSVFDETSPASPESDSDESNAEAENASIAATTDVLPEPVEQENLSDGYVPTLDPVNMNQVLDRQTGFYYYHAEEGEDLPASSAEITSWKKVEDNTELAPADLVKAYFAYTIPAGTLNETNQVARYRLPANLHLTDDQIMAINQHENGISASYIDYDTLEILDSDNYHKYLGAEAIDGTRTPDQTLVEGTQEYISAVVKAENVYENTLDADGNYVTPDGAAADGPGAYLGQDLIFIFTPYSIEKNQITYDSKGNPTAAGEKVSGWFACDFNLEQVDFGEPKITTTIVGASDADLPDGQTEYDWTDNDSTDSIADDKNKSIIAESVEEAENSQNHVVTKECAESIAEIVFVKEGLDEKGNRIDQISTLLKMVKETMSDVQDGDPLESNADPSTNDKKETSGEEDKETMSDDISAEEDEKVSEDTDQNLMPAVSFNDSIKVTTGRPVGFDKYSGSTLVDAAESLPEEAEVSVRVEADEGTFPVGTTMVLRAVDQSSIDTLAETLAEAVEKGNSSDADTSGIEIDSYTGKTKKTEDKEKNQNNANTKAYGFQAVDITFLDKDGNEIEPAKPVRVAMTSAVVEQAREQVEDSAISAPVVVHVDNEGNAEQMELISPEEVEPAKGRSGEELFKEVERTAGSAEADDANKDSPADIKDSRNILTDTARNSDGESNSVNETGADDKSNTGDTVADSENIKDENGTTDASEPASVTGSTIDDTTIVEEDKEPGDKAEFDANSFSVYAIVYTVELYTNVITDSGETYRITVTFDETSGIPQDAELKVKEIKEGDKGYENYHTEAVKAASISSDTRNDVQNKEDKWVNPDKTFARFFDIEIWANGEKVEPAGDVSVSIRLLDVPEADDRNVIKIVHFDQNDIEVIPYTVTSDHTEITGTKKDKENNRTKNNTHSEMEFNFTANSFSVYSVISYTVDFHWEVNGKLFEFSLPGGGFVSLQQLVEILGIVRASDVNAKANENEETADTGETNSDKKNNNETVKAGNDIVTEGKSVESWALENGDSADIDKGTNHRGEENYNDDKAVQNRPLTLGDVAVSDETRKFVADVEKVEFSSPDIIWVGKTDVASTVGRLKEVNELEVQYSVELTEDEIRKINDTKVESGDWAIISMLPFKSEEALTVIMRSGESFRIKVTDAQSDAVMDGDYVDTISNPAGTTIDLFDYWIDSNKRNNTAEGAWPGPRGSIGDGDKQGINASGKDTSHGHALKFTPAYGNSVHDGTLNNWNQGASDGGQGVNSWTKNANPRQGLVTNKLENGYPRLSNNNTLGTTDESLSYLFDNTEHEGKETYFGVNHLLYVDSEGFYKFDSNDFNAVYDKDTRQFKLTKQDLQKYPDPGEDRGFWPFGHRVWWHGMHVNTQFSMPTDGKVLSPTGKYNDMIFEFQGDDDTWVYVDGILIGDGGGIHNQTFIKINFQNGTVTVDGQHDVKDAYRTDWTQTKYLEDLFKAAEKYNAEEWIQVKDANGNPVTRTDSGHNGQPLMTFKPGTYHTFDMFYLERGGGESNLHIRYNLISTADFTAHKSYHSEANHRLLKNQFQFELIGLDGQYRGELGNLELVDADKPAIMPKGGSETGNGLVGSPRKVRSDGSTVFTVGVSEDGNVNFGDADISSEEMRNCDNGSPSTYRYMVREIVPPDAVNADGKTWASATPEERAEGGFHKVDSYGEDVSYDGRTYYMEATVVRWKVKKADGTEGWKYGLNKTYYTDSTFQTPDTNTNFISFMNGQIDPLTLKVLKKNSKETNVLPGAEFKLTRAVFSEGKWAERSGSTVQTKTSDAQGVLTFDNPKLTEGHFLLEEITPPAGYQQSENMWLVTLTKKDTASGIILVPTITLLGDDGTPLGEPETLTVDNNTLSFEKTIVNSPMPKGNVTVVKKWLKPNGEEYTQEEMSQLDISNTKITGELWRKGLGTTQKQVKNPTVTIYGKKSETPNLGKGEVLLSTQPVVSGSAIEFWVYRDNSINSSVTTNNGSKVQFKGRPTNGDYSTLPPYRYVYKLENIKTDTEITVTLNGQNSIRYGTVSSDPGSEYSMQQVTGEIDQKVDGKNFELTGSTWSITWTREELGEGQDDTFTYYLKNVVEENPNGFTFLKDETGTIDPLTGTITFIQKNTNEKTQVKIKKEWTPMPENLSQASAKVSLHRYRMLTKGLFQVTLISDQGAAIPGARFELYKDSEMIGSYITDNSGKITVGELSEGEYYLLQKTTPSPYRMEGTVKTETFTVSGDSFDNQEFKETLVNYTSEPAGLFTVQLNNPEGEGLENGIFDLYKQGENEPVIIGVSTNQDGRWTTDRLREGTYYFVQTGAPEGYVLPETTQTDSFTINDPSQVQEKTVTVVNQHRAQGSVKVTLTKANNGSPISGAEFELYRNGILLKSGTTDTTGIVNFTDLSAGSYQVKQKTSASGWNIRTEMQPDPAFVIQENGDRNQHKDISITNTESAGNVTLNVYRARTNDDYNSEVIKTYNNLKANTTYQIRVGVPAKNITDDGVAYCGSFTPGVAPRGETRIPTSNWENGPAYAGEEMKYYTIEFTPTQDNTVYNIAMVCMKGWGLYPMTVGDTPTVVQQITAPSSTSRMFTRTFSTLLKAPKGNKPQKTSGTSNDVQPEVPTGYKEDTGFTPLDYTIRSSDSWEHTFPNLDKYDENGNPYIYYVLEGDRTPAEYSVASYETNADGSEITVKNISTIELTLKKIDQTDMEKVKEDGKLDNVSLLDGASFKLVKYSVLTPNKIKDINWNRDYSIETSGSEGTFTFSDVSTGYYEIVETAYPAGYIHPAKTPFIQVMPDLSIRLIKEDGTVLDTAETIYLLDEATIVYGNEPGAALPNSGGYGTKLIYILGVLLTTISLILLGKKQIRM